MHPWYARLDSSPCFLIRRGSNINPQKLVPGSIVMYANDLDEERPLAAPSESMDRVAGAISEDC